MREFVIVLLSIALIGTIAKKEMDSGKLYKKAYSSGYKRAKLLYECDHDRTECELIKDTL